MKKAYFIICILLISAISFASIIIHRNRNELYPRDNPSDKKALGYTEFFDDPGNSGMLNFDVAVTPLSPTNITVAVSGLSTNNTVSMAYAVDADPTAWTAFQKSFTAVHQFPSGTHSLRIKMLFRNRKESAIRSIPFTSSALSDADSDGIPDYTVTVNSLTTNAVRITLAGVDASLCSEMSAAIDSAPAVWQPFTNVLIMSSNGLSFGAHNLLLRMKSISGTAGAVNTVVFTNERMMYVSAGGDDTNSGVRLYPLKTIQTAIERAVMHGITNIRVQAGTYYRGEGLLFDVKGGILLTNMSISLVGGYDASFTSRPSLSELDGGGAFRVVYMKFITNCLFDGFAVKNGNASGAGGGGIYIERSLSNIITNCRIFNNRAYNGGGIGIDIDASVIKVYGSVFNNIVDSGVGGGIYISQGSERTINADVYGNSGASNGGGIFLYSYTSTTTIRGKVYGNTAYNRGGGIFVNGENASCTSVVINADVFGNVAVCGAGLFVNGSTFTPGNLQNLTIAGTIRDNNGSSSYYSYGGGIFLSNVNPPGFSFTADVNDNTAGFGGGLYIHAPTNIIFANGRIFNNRAAYGSGLYIVNADSGGTAVYTPVFSNNGNYIGGKAGGVMLSNCIGVNVTNVYANNAGTASVGGGVYIYGGRSNRVSGYCSGNQGYDCSGVYIANSVHNFISAVLTNNNANAIMFGTGALSNFVTNCLIGGTAAKTMYAIYEQDTISNHTITTNIFCTNMLTNLYYNSTGAVVSNQDVALLNTPLHASHNAAAADGNSVTNW